MTDEERAELDRKFRAREEALEAAMPVLSEFFHIVRCPNHTKQERTEAYERACAAWDGFEESYVREITLLERLAILDNMNHKPDASTTEMLDTETGKTINVHPGSRTIN